MNSEVALPALPEGVNSPAETLLTRGTLKAVIVAGLVCLTLWLHASSDLPWIAERRWLGTAIILVCALPIVSFANHPERWYVLTPSIALAYMIAFGVPAFTLSFPPPLHGDLLREPEYERAAEMILLGCTALVLGMFLPVHRVISGKGWNWPGDEKLSPKRFALAAVVGGTSLVLVKAEVVPGPLVQPAVYLGHLSEIGTIVVFTLWSRKKAPFLWCVVAIGGVLPALIVSFGSGALWQVVEPFLIFLAAYYALTRRIPFGLLIVGATLFLPANIAKHEYRARLQYGPIPLMEQPVAFGKIIWAGLFEEKTITVEHARDTMSDRIDHVTAMAEVVSSTPDIIPYWAGETYKTLLYTPIPRVVMPDKPEKRLGQEFGHRYHFIGDDNFDTSVNLAQLVEAYANFGTIGVAIVMLLVGLLYSTIEILFSRPSPPVAMVAVAAVVVAKLMNIESDFSLVNGGLIISVPFLWILTHMMCWRGPR